MNIQDTLTALVAYVLAVGLIYIASWMSGLSMDDFVGWVALGMAAGMGAKR